MSEQVDIWKLLAGLGIFLFGMYLMEESVKKLSGRAFKRFIRTYTTGKIQSIFSGAFVTAILQSSSAVSLMLLAFVGAGIMSMENAIGVILGSNIGTTVTAWIVATVGFNLNIESFALPLIGTGGLGLIFLQQSEKYANISKLLVGFGFLFMGLDYMKLSVEAFANRFDITTLPDFGLWFYALVGLFLTAIMQSSSATMAIILTTLHAGLFSFDIAATMVIGANVGTTVTILLGTIGGVQVKKRVAYSHLVFNLITGILAFLLLPVLLWVVQLFFNLQTQAVMGLALFHTFFNVLGVLVFFPFIVPLTRLLYRLFPDQQLEITHYINNTTAEIPDAAISALKDECIHLVYLSLSFNMYILSIDEKLVFEPKVMDALGNKNKPATFDDRYIQIKQLQAAIFTFAADVQKNELSESEAADLNRFLHSARMALHAAKALKDIKLDLDAFESADNPYLNNQYATFRKRMMETYLKLYHCISDSPEKDKLKSLLKLWRHDAQEDAFFVQQTTEAISKKQIDQINVSTALIANRVFVQSIRQLILALRELLLSVEEVAQFDRVQELSNDINENA